MPGELVIYWSHAYTAAPHEFEVIYCPETPTEAQLERVAEIQNELEEKFFGKSGLIGISSCPSIGQGWGLFPRKVSEGCSATTVTPGGGETGTDSADEDGEESFGATLGELFPHLLG